MFQTRIFRENLNKILMQCSHSKHVNIIQTWSYNCNKIKLVCINTNITSINFFWMSKKWKKWKTWTPCHCLCQKNLNKICMLLSNLKIHLSKPIYSSHHVVCSSISSYCCNHLNNMSMNVKLIVIQLELNDIGYKLVFHNYSKSTSNTWYTLICKFEKYEPNLKKLHGYEHI
jgi:hypothetical protein